MATINLYTPQNYVQDSVDRLAFAHRWVLKRTGLTEDEWFTLVMEYGERFASIFSLLFPHHEQWVEDILTKTPPAEGEAHNWFWMWFKYRWMTDDYEYVHNKLHQQPISYEHYKTYLLHDEILEQELLNLLNEKHSL